MVGKNVKLSLGECIVLKKPVLHENNTIHGTKTMWDGKGTMGVIKGRWEGSIEECKSMRK